MALLGLVLAVSFAVASAQEHNTLAVEMVQAEASASSIVWENEPNSYQQPSVGPDVCNSRCREWIHGTHASVTAACDFRNVCVNVCSIGHNFVDERNSELVEPQNPYPDVDSLSAYSSECRLALKNTEAWCDTRDLYCACSACSPNVVSDTDQRDALVDGRASIKSDGTPAENEQSNTAAVSDGTQTEPEEQGRDEQAKAIVDDLPGEEHTKAALVAIVPEPALVENEQTVSEEPKSDEPPMPPPYDANDSPLEAPVVVVQADGSVTDASNPDGRPDPPIPPWDGEVPEGNWQMVEERQARV